MTNTFSNLFELSKRHLLAIIFALFFGVFVLAPQIIFIVSEGSHYKGLYMMKTEAETFYLARMHEFYDEGKIGNPYLSEPYKFHGRPFVQSGAETILAIPGKLLNISLPTLNLIYKFLLPAITFLLLYALIFRLTASLPWSIAGALMFLVGSTWLYANNLSHFLRGDVSFFDGFVYNRPVHPQFDGILTFLYLNVLLSVHRGKNAFWFLVLGALLGLSFYTYFYNFTFFLALNSIFALLWLLSGKKRQVWNLVFATIGGTLLGIPQLLAIHAATQHPDYALYTAVVGPEYGHAPQVSKNGLLVALLLVAYFFRTRAERVIGVVRELRSRFALVGDGAVPQTFAQDRGLDAGSSSWSEHMVFLSGLLITTFIVVNQQVLTGVTLYPGHFHHNFNLPVYIIILVFLASTVISRLTPTHSFTKIILRALPWIASVVFIATGAFVQYSSYVFWASQTSKEQRYMPALSWLERETAKGSVVMANLAISDIIPVFTSNNTMWAQSAAAYLVPADRARFTPENLLSSNDFLRDIKQYRVDYILWDQQADPSWNISRFQLPQLFSSEGLVIYQLPK